MNFVKQLVVPAITALVVVLLVLMFRGFFSPVKFSAVDTTCQGSTTCLTALYLSDAIQTAGTATFGGASTFTTGVFSGLVTLDAGQLRSYTSATTTGAAVTLKVSDVAGYDTISMKPIVSATTVTFFASSTASTWLPTAGDMQMTCFQDASSTAAETITFAAGTGIDLQTVATSSSAGTGYLTIQPSATGCFTFIRGVSAAAPNDIQANLVTYIDAD